MDESAIGFIEKSMSNFSFCHPPLHHKITVFLYFSVGSLIEQTFDKIRSGLLEQNILEHVFVLYFYRIFWNLLLTTIINCDNIQLSTKQQQISIQKILFRKSQKVVDNHNLL
jgi:hypothetical protein